MATTSRVDLLPRDHRSHKEREADFNEEWVEDASASIFGAMQCIFELILDTFYANGQDAVGCSFRKFR